MKCWQDGGIEGFRFFVENVWHPPCAHPTHIPFKEYNWAWAENCLKHKHCGNPAPRGHRKTTGTAEPLAAWETIHHPNEAWLIVSSTPGLAGSTLADIHQKLTTEWWAEGWPGPGAVWPGLIKKWKAGPPARLFFSTRQVPRREPNLTGAGIFGDGIASYHYDGIIADDVVGEEHARTEGQRLRTTGLWNNKLVPTRSGRMLLWRFFTYYHPVDLNVLAVKAGLPICDRYKSAVIGDINDPEAQALDSDLYSIEILRELYHEIGPVSFGLQFMNDASAAEGAFFKWEWIDGAGEDYEVPDRFAEVILTADPAYNDTLDSDYSVVVVAAKGLDGHFYLLDWFRGRFDAVVQVAEPIARLHKRWRPVWFGSETGPGANNQLWRQLKVELHNKYSLPGLQEIRADRSKPIRAVGLQRHLQSGVWKFPRSKPGFNALRDELLSFPHGTHDDFVDALAHADNRLTGSRRSNAKPSSGYATEAEWAKS